MTTTKRDRDLIEQAIARGWLTSRIMRELGYSYRLVQAVRDDMLTPPSEPRGTKQPQCGPSQQSRYVQRRLTEAVIDRPWYTYFGPADPEVIADLIAALFPHDRRGGRAA